MKNTTRTRLPAHIAASSVLLLVACGGSDEAGQPNTGTSGGRGGAGIGGGASTGATGSGAAGTGATNGGGAPAGGGTSAPPTGTSDWTMLGYDPASTYHNTTETRINVASAPTLAIRHQLDLETPISSAPIMVGDRVYAAGAGVFCHDVVTGALLWRNVDFAASTATFAYAAGVLYAHHSDAVLRAYDAESGAVLWERPTSQHPDAIAFSSPMISGDLVVVGGSTLQELNPAPPDFRGYVYAVNKNTGEEVWNTFTVGEGETGASLWSTVAFDEAHGKVYATTGNNYALPATATSDAILQLDMATGAIEWAAQRYEGDVWSYASASLGNPDFDFGANPIVFDAEVDGVMTELVAGAQKSGDAHVLRRADGSEVWTRKLSPGLLTGEMGIFNNGAWTGKYLLWAGNGATSAAPGGDPHTSSTQPSVLFAIAPATGDIVWERQLNGVVMAPITVAGGVGFVGADQQLQAFDVETGEVLLRVDVVGTIGSAPTVANGRVAFGSGLNWLFGTTGSTLTILDLP